MSNKTDSYVSEDERGYEWHLEYPYTAGMPCPFPIVPAGTRPKHDPVSDHERARLIRKDARPIGGGIFN